VHPNAGPLRRFGPVWPPHAPLPLGHTPVVQGERRIVDPATVSVLQLNRTAMRNVISAAVIAAIGYSGAACVTHGRGLPAGTASDSRRAVIARASIWTSTNVSSMNLRTGPQGAGAFRPGAAVSCDYVDVRLSGNSPKFACQTRSGDRLKVKHGTENGEVYGEVLATRLLWALGFGADRMYVVNVNCMLKPGLGW
jgi:hypothetical protein